MIKFVKMLLLALCVSGCASKISSNEKIKKESIETTHEKVWFDAMACNEDTAAKISSYIADWNADHQIGLHSSGLPLVEYSGIADSTTRPSDEVTFSLTSEKDNILLGREVIIEDWSKRNRLIVADKIQQHFKRSNKQREILGQKPAKTIRIVLAFSPDEPATTVQSISNFIIESGHRLGFVFRLPKSKVVPPSVFAQYGLKGRTEPKNEREREIQGSAKSVEVQERITRLASGNGFYSKGPSLSDCQQITSVYEDFEKQAPAVRKKSWERLGTAWVECGCSGSINGHVLSAIPYDVSILTVKNMDVFDDSTIVVSSDNATWADVASQVLAK